MTSVWLYKFALLPARESVCLAPHPYQHNLSFVLLMLGILTCIIWNFKVGFICISQMTKGVKHFCTCFSPIWASSFNNSLFRSVPSFYKCIIFWYLISCFLESLYILNFNPLLDVELLKNILPFCKFLLCSLESVLCLIEIFEFHEGLLITCWSFCLWYQCSSQKVI